MTLLTLCAAMRPVIEPNLVLEGNNVRLEALEARHLPALRAECHDPALWEYTFSDSPFGDDESALRGCMRPARIRRCMHLR